MHDVIRTASYVHTNEYLNFVYFKNLHTFVISCPIIIMYISLLAIYSTVGAFFFSIFITSESVPLVGVVVAVHVRLLRAVQLRIGVGTRTIVLATVRAHRRHSGLVRAHR